MAFLNKNIIGNGTAQSVVVNDAILEVVVNSLVANNTTVGSLDFSLLIDDVVVFTENVDANATYRIPDKVNMSANSELKINAATGLNVSVSYLQQAIDSAGALSAAQTIVDDADTAFQTYLTQASDDADRAEAALGDNSAPIITGSITEQVSVGTDSITASNGTVVTRTLTADTTFTDGLSEGQTVTYLVTNAGYTITYPTISWFGDEAPELGSVDKLFFEKIGGVLYGTHSGSIA